MQEKETNNSLKMIRSPAKKAIVLVCKKCGKGLEHSGREFRQSLKHELKKSKNREVRVVLTSCLDICPKNGIALAISSTESETEFLIWRGDSAENGAKKIVSHLDESSPRENSH